MTGGELLFIIRGVNRKQRRKMTHTSTEQQRRAEEDARNTSRFFQHNRRRRAVGLPTFSFEDYLDRKHGLTQSIRQARKLMRGDS